ncbi:MAG: efflux RND transporter periplasmic adaptor subunit [Verrucomicrobia bacterium]|nr:efflux RND transporter periplasmic adaptor subunit [Verrucomicrobiota bacterium]
MKSQKKPYSIALFVVCATVLGLFYWRYAGGSTAGLPEKKVLYYQDSMHPWVKSDRPGKCTICAMDLTPILEGQQGFGAAEEIVTMPKTGVTVANVQTEEARTRTLTRTLRVAGTLEADSTRKTILAAPAAGRIDNVRVASAGVDVSAGQVLATLYSPELTFQTRRYIFRDRITEQSGQSMPMPGAILGSTRQMQASGETSRTRPLPVTEKPNSDPFYNDLLATHSGTVTERRVFDGQYVSEGDLLFAIVDCSVLWFRFDVYEQQLPWLAPGQRLEVTIPSIPGKAFDATIAVIEPILDQSTRTVKVRADVENPAVGDPGQQQRLLRIGMYADGSLSVRAADVLTVPRSAVLFPGSHAYVYVAKAPGAYEMRQVELGRQGDEHWEVLKGVEEGEHVVVTGNVLIDSQAQLVRGNVPELKQPAADSARQAESDSEPAIVLSETQYNAVGRFLEVADGISAALAADNVAQLEQHAKMLGTAASSLGAAFSADHPWHALVESAVSSSKWPSIVDLDAARKVFLPFSTNVVELVQSLRSEDARFASLKVFFCPMAPKPGVWFQAKGPLRNPYYGAKMLYCGEEVTAPAARTRNQAPAKQSPASPPTLASAHAHASAHGATNAPAGAPAPAAKGLSVKPNISSRTDSTLAGQGRPPTSSQLRAIEEFIGSADALARGLASDDLGEYNKQSVRMTSALAALQKEFQGQQRLTALIRQLSALSRSGAPKTIDDARKRFVHVSASTVELAKQMRSQSGLSLKYKVFHCPMAPQPGLWLQVDGPLRNPYYGAAMLTCGEEVVQ